MPRITCLLALFALLASTGCSGVYPTYSRTAREAAYDLRSDGASFGSARVTSAAAEDLEVNGEERAVLSVSVLVDNTGPDEVRVNAKDIALAYVVTTNARVEGAAVAVVTRKVSEAGDGVARVEASFALPAGHSAREVRQFALRWAVVRNGELFEELTAFLVPAPAAAPLANVYPLTPLATSQFEIYGGYAGPAAGYLPESGVYIAPPPSYAPAQPTFPSWHAPAQPSISHGHAPAQPSVGGGRR